MSHSARTVDRRSAADRIRLHARILDSLGQAIIATDLDGAIQYWNDGAERLFGWPADDVQGRLVTDVTPALAETPDADGILSRLAAGDSWRGEFLLRRRDGSEFPALVTDTPVHDDTGKLVGIVGITEDLTRQKRAEAEWDALLAEVEAASRAKSEFLAVISHELRTPLTAIIGFVELLLLEVDGPIREAQRARLQRIIANSLDLRELIAEILDFVSLKDGIEAPNASDVDAVRVVDEVVAELGHAAELKGLTIECDLEPIVLRTDRDRVCRVVRHLVANAIKFTAEGRITIRTRAEPGHVRIDVLDNGPGIPMSERKRIFEPFVQLDQSSTRGVGGTGLGLAMVRRFVEVAGGEVLVADAPGGGAAFTIRLPHQPPER